MRREGNDCRLVTARLYQGGTQKDGWVLLALRRFLQQARDAFGLTAVVLVGRFPEAQILRRWPWAPAYERTISGVATAGRRYLAVAPELVAASADAVLGDPTGGWEQLYRPSVTSRGLYLLPTGADATHADWLRTGHEISGNVVEFEPEVTTRDVFYLDEARIRQNLIGPIARVWIDQFRSDPEIAAASRTLPNPIALPEIAVSRINASHVAVRLPSDRSLATGTRGRLVDGAVTDAARPVHQHRQLRHRAERRPGRVGDPARRVRTGPAPRTPAAGRASGQQPPLPHRGVVDPARFGGRGGSSGRRRLLRTRGRRCAGAGAARGGPAS